MVKCDFRLAAALALLTCVAPSLEAVPTIHARSSTAQVRKGEPFKIFLTISAPEKIDALHISLIPPTGFNFILENKDLPPTLELGSSYTVVYRIDPPKSISLPDAGGDTREQKTFVFNVDYQSSEGSTPHRIYESTELTLPYSINPLWYITSGILGLIIGNILKMLTKQRGQPAAANAQSIRTLFRNNLVTLLTGIAIGFVVLLILSRDTIPTKGWYDSLAIGVAVAILADEQLLSKVGAMKP
jgi:hypothetical protein